MVQNNITPSINNTGRKPGAWTPHPSPPQIWIAHIGGIWNEPGCNDNGRIPDVKVCTGANSVIVYLDSGPLQTAPSVDRLRVQASRYCAISILFISESENTSKGSSSGYILPGEHTRCQKNCTSRLNWHLCWYFSPRKARHCSASL